MSPTKRERLQVVPLSRRLSEAQGRNLELQRSSSARPKADSSAEEDQDRILSRFSKNLSVVQKYLPNIHQLTQFKSNVASYLNPRLRNRVGPTMDRRWWFYNVCLALSPALCIALLCEYYQDDMKEFYQEQEKREMKRAQSLMETRREDLGQAVTMGAKDISYRKRHVIHNHVPTTLATDTVHPSTLISWTRVLATYPWFLPYLNSVCTATALVDLGHPIDTTNSTPPTIETLLHRIQQLEAVVQSHENQQILDNYQKQRKWNQSGIRNRIEDKLLSEGRSL